MKRILITGATGNIGREVIHFLSLIDNDSEIIAGARNINEAKKRFSYYSDLNYRRFDFDDSTSFPTAFENITVLFLLRPPHISQIEEYFHPLLTSAKENGIEKIVFLSVQGAEKRRLFPTIK